MPIQNARMCPCCGAVLTHPRQKYCGRECYWKSKQGPRLPLLDRFWSKVDKDGPISQHVPGIGQCWLWTASKTTHGQGIMRLDGKNVLAYRVSFQMFFGSIPEGMNILHRCDNPSCVNPEHLFLGTQADNIADMWNKGRGAVGSRLPHTRLSTDDVMEIRDLFNGGRSRRAIALRFGIKPATVYDITVGRRRARVI